MLSTSCLTPLRQAPRLPTGTLLCAVAMTILGSSFAVSRLLLGYPTLTGQALRYAGAAVLLALLAARSPRVRPVRRGDLVRLGALAFTGLTGFNVCVLAALWVVHAWIQSRHAAEARDERLVHARERRGF